MVVDHSNRSRMTFVALILAQFQQRYGQFSNTYSQKSPQKPSFDPTSVGPLHLMGHALYRNLSGLILITMKQAFAHLKI